MENKTGLSRKKQLQAYDNCARLRPIWDELAAPYDVVITPSVVDEAPMGLENTGDMVSSFALTLVILASLTYNFSPSAPCGQFFIAHR